MRGRRYIAVIALSWAILLVLGWYFIYDIPRMANAEVAHQQKLASIGAVMYAENCVVCHGPVGEGVVGPPLNKEAFRANPKENKEIYDMIYQTIADGRPGTTTPHWVRLADGSWASYTAMPLWAAEKGGPMNEQQIAALTHFLMMGDWNQVGRHIPAVTPFRNEDGSVAWEKLPNGRLSAEEAQAGKEIFVNKACISCHTLGSVGGHIGPDLTQVGSWVDDEEVWKEFLKSWIADPPSVEKRAPTYWSNYGGPYELPFDAARTSAPSQDAVRGETTSEGDTQLQRGGRDEMVGGSLGPDFPIPDTEVLPPTTMPNMGLTDEEIETLVNYLINLK